MNQVQICLLSMLVTVEIDFVESTTSATTPVSSVTTKVTSTTAPPSITGTGRFG